MIFELDYLLILSIGLAALYYVVRKLWPDHPASIAATQVSIFGACCLLMYCAGFIHQIGKVFNTL